MHKDTSEILQVTIKSWKHTSPNLFDFKNDEITTNTNILNSNSYLIKQNETIQIKTVSNSVVDNTIASITLSNNKFTFHPREKNNTDYYDMFYFNLLGESEYDTETPKYELSIGDVIKLGKTLLKVREISKGTKMHLKRKLPKINNKNKNLKKRNILCRICYNTEDEDPLINPCKCSGGVKYIHLGCLQHWIQTKSIRETNDNNICKVYSISDVSCEICEEAYTDFILKDNKLFEIITLPNIKSKNYMILESIQKDKNDSRIIYFLNFDISNKISVGRSHEMDLRLNDICISRQHAMLIYSEKKGKFFIRDSFSKFGSFVMIRNKIELPISSFYPLRLHVGGVLINFVIQEKGCACLMLKNFCQPEMKYRLFDLYGKHNKGAIVLEEIFTLKECIDTREDEEREDVNIDNFEDKNQDNLIIKSVKADDKFNSKENELINNVVFYSN